MEKILINQVYLEQLKSLSEQQNESSFVSHLIEHLESEYQNALQGELTLPLLHCLKNSFSNLGAESASHLLEEIHYAMEQHETGAHDVSNLWKKFRSTAEQTIEQLAHLK